MAPQKFHDWLANLFLSIGFRRMVGHPAYFRHDEKDVQIEIHIDDGIIASPPAQVTEITQILQGKVAMKDLGSIDKHGKKYLGKIIKRTTMGFTIQADPEFYDRLLEETGLYQGVSSPTPGTNAMKPTAVWEKEAWDEDLDKDSQRHYRKIVGMLRWLVAERREIMFDANNVSENLQPPKYRHWQVKRMVKYLAGTRENVQKTEVNSEVIAGKSVDEHSLVGWSDTDFARDVESRKSTSCSVLRLDGAVIHTHSREQTLIATSTAEAEMYGILSVTFEGFSIRSLLRGLGSSVELTTMTDSDAGRAVKSRKGFGKLDSRCSGQEKGHVEARAEHFQRCRSGHKTFHPRTV